MKKIVSLLLVLTMVLALCACGAKEEAAPAAADAYTVGVCQLMEHESLDKATNGFIDALTAELEAALEALKNRVTVYSGASILGGDTVIGDDCIIGGNAFVTSSVPDRTRVSVESPSLTFRELSKTIWEKA